jgi:hypothetical protein
MAWHSTSELNCIQNSVSVIGGAEPGEVATHSLVWGIRTHTNVPPSVVPHFALSGPLEVDEPPHATTKAAQATAIALEKPNT